MIRGFVGVSAILMLAAGQADPFSDFQAGRDDMILSTRGYAYITAILIFSILAILVYFHVSSVRRNRLMEQYAEHGIFAEWSPLLIDNKHIRPPPPYEQVV